MNTATENQELIKRREIPNTPFIMITTEDKSFLTVGRYRVTPEFEHPYECEEYLESHMWEIIFTLINCVQDAYINATATTGQSAE